MSSWDGRVQVAVERGGVKVVIVVFFVCRLLLRVPLSCNVFVIIRARLRFRVTGNPVLVCQIVNVVSSPGTCPRAVELSSIIQAVPSATRKRRNEVFEDEMVGPPEDVEGDPARHGEEPATDESESVSRRLM